MPADCRGWLTAPLLPLGYKHWAGDAPVRCLSLVTSECIASRPGGTFLPCVLEVCRRVSVLGTGSDDVQN